jgi:hypothetical protein
MTEEAPAAVAESDPLQTIATAMKHASQAAGEETIANPQNLPAGHGIVWRNTYSVFYYTAYGLTLPALFVAYTVPGFGPIADGLIDGASAACSSISRRKAARQARIEAGQEQAAVSQQGQEALDPA